MLDDAGSPVILPRSDRRAEHIVSVLRRSEGERFDVGLPDGRMGKALVLDISKEAVAIAVEWGDEAPPLHPIVAVIGLPRPQTARRLLRELTALGVSKMVFCGTDRGESGYEKSRLWSGGEYLRHVRDGAEQAFNPRMPAVEIVASLDAALDATLDATKPTADKVALDNYEGTSPLSAWEPRAVSLTLALGAERGWSDAERRLLRARGFDLHHLGSRVLRVEAAAVAAVAIAQSRLGLM